MNNVNNVNDMIDLPSLREISFNSHSFCNCHLAQFQSTKAYTSVL